MKPKIAVHGGAGTMPKEQLTEEVEMQCKNALHQALLSGYQILDKGGSALDAVEASVITLENFPLFNSGRGSVFTHTGIHEMDASIMDGSTLDAGAIAGVSNIKNPVTLAKRILEKSEHLFLFGAGAEEFARLHNIEFADNEYFFTQFRYDQLLKAKENDVVVLDHVDFNKGKNKMGTVGAVAIDSNNNLAAATSTGGMTNKSFGRVGDTPIIGAGTYANNNSVAVSCTGHGEFFMRYVVAYDIHCLITYKNLSLEEAANFLVNNTLKNANAEGGLIAIDNKGNIVLPFNSAGMYRGWMNSESEFFTGIF